jgi:hypothetical protein
MSSSSSSYVYDGAGETGREKPTEKDDSEPWPE